MWPVVAVVVSPVLLVVLWLALSYNRFASQRASIASTWAGIDVQLQRRHDLVPNLVETVRGYAAHERAVFEQVTRARAEAVRAEADPTVDPAGMARAESSLSGATRALLAVAEGYPDLQAARNFRDLQAQLVETEDRLSAARRLYNIEVQHLNRRVEAFPSNLVASMFGFDPATYFELTDLAARRPPSVAD